MLSARGPRSRARSEGREYLDGSQLLDPAALAVNLDDLAALKRWLGYGREVWGELRALASHAPGQGLTVLDVATGGADLPREIVTRAAHERLAWRTVALDLHPQVAAEARRRTVGLGGLAVVRGDAVCLPLSDAGVDVALCTFSLHHFSWAAARALLAEMARVARRGMIVSDLARSRSGYLAARALGAVWGSAHRFSRHDAPLSMRRAYTARELERLAAEAGLPEPVVVRRPFHATLLAPRSAFRASSRRPQDP